MDIYRNLHNGKWSIRDGGLIIGHADGVLVKDAALIVNEAGRLRVIREKRKNVHAFVRGDLTAVSGFVKFKGRGLPAGIEKIHTIGRLDRRASYNPYKAGAFTVDGEPIAETRLAALSEDGKLYVSGT